MQLGKIYNKAFEYRQKFDYVDFAEPDLDLVESYISQAREFIDEIKQYLRGTPAEGGKGK